MVHRKKVLAKSAIRRAAALVPTIVRRQFVWRRLFYIFCIAALLFLLYDAVPRPSAWAKAPAGLVNVDLVHVKTKVIIAYDGKNTEFWTTASTIKDAVTESKIPFANYDATQPALDTPLSGSATSVRVERARPITIIDNGITYETYTAFHTVKEVLSQLRFELFEEDLVTPSLDAVIDAHTKIIIVRSQAIHIAKDGSVTNVHTNASTVQELLEDQKIDLTGYRVVPELTAVLHPGMEIKIIRLGESEEHETIKIPFRTIDQNDNTMLLGQQKISQVGKEGVREKVYKVRQEDGREVSRTLISDTITAQPIDRIVLHGTKVLIGQTQTGLSSWYGVPGMVAAHRTFPRGTKLRVTNQANGKSVTVTVAGYGPQPYTGRILDLSKDAFAQIAPLGQGVISVKVEELL